MASTVLPRLRALMSAAGLKAYVVPMEDAHQSEYIADVDKRLQHVCSFTGSRGYGVVTMDKAAMWTDGRYFQQARAEMPSEWTLMKEGEEETPTSADWLCQVLNAGDVVGVDPLLIAHASFTHLSSTLAKCHITMKAHQPNLVDGFWTSQPGRPTNVVNALPTKYSGETWQSKVQRVNGVMKQKNVTALVLSALDDIAWTFNLRGSDILFNPVFFSYAIVEHSKCTLFVSPAQSTAILRAHLADDALAVEFVDYADVEKTLTATVARLRGEEKIWMAGKTTSHALAMLVPESNIYSEASPVLAMKAVKNATELDGFRHSHIKDGVAHVEFLYWLENKMREAKPTVTENSAADYIAARRAEQKDFVSLSFGTISAVGAHASSPHYHPDPTAVHLLDTDQVYLDGTTDVTRTMVFQKHGNDTLLRQAYTLVLKGHINLARQHFPSGTNGMRLDTLTRKDMWNVGLDFGHGTGHGVGHYLNVHEGPAGIGHRSMVYAQEGIVEGMVLTIEPGYYHAGAFGIRIENVYIVRAASTQHPPMDGKPFLSFEPVTFVPIETTLIDVRLLTFDEVTWLNFYHAQCEEKLGEELRRQGKLNIAHWLKQACAPLAIKLIGQH